jgi:hypothetical protein
LVAREHPADGAVADGALQCEHRLDVARHGRRALGGGRLRLRLRCLVPGV